MHIAFDNACLSLFLMDVQARAERSSEHSFKDMMLANKQK